MIEKNIVHVEHLIRRREELANGEQARPDFDRLGHREYVFREM
ncbi:MAG: hypothetical protein R3338_15245 [Thermoanaerobaculia bacterium]|nr:hypothetical protein [Thermoanaerobaculia bacterium]